MANSEEIKKFPLGKNNKKSYCGVKRLMLKVIIPSLVNLHYQPATSCMLVTVRYLDHDTTLTCSSCARFTNIGTRSDFKYSTSTTLAKSPNLPLAALEERVE